jgi:MFS family permease
MRRRTWGAGGISILQEQQRRGLNRPWWAGAGFARLWTGQFLSLLADWSLRAMLLIWVYTLTRSGALVSLVGVAEALPLLLVAPFAGAFVDRWHRARTMTGVVLARAILVLPLLAVSTQAQLPLLLVVTVLVNVASQFFMPAAAAATPVVVGSEHLGQANSLLSYVNSTVGILGPATGALLFTTIGPHLTIMALALLYIGAAPVLVGIPAARSTDSAVSETGLAREIATGMHYVWQTVILRSLLGNAFVYCLGAGTLSVLDVLFVSRALHLHTNLVSALYMANGAGALLGSTVMTLTAHRVRGRYHRILSCCVVANACAVLLYALAPALIVAMIAVSIAGLVFSMGLTSFITLIQLATHNRLMGRVMSVCNMTVAAGLICSYTCGGLLADRLGVREVAGGCALMLLLCGVLCFALIRATPAPAAAVASATPLSLPELDLAH